MLWAEEAARAEPRGENELGRSEEQKGALWLLQPGGCSRQRGAGGVFTTASQVTGRHPISPRKSQQRF